MKRAVVLLSGGVDSTTVLYIARKEGYECYGLVFDYGQRHKREIESAKEIAKGLGISLQLLKIEMPWAGSMLLEKTSKLPERDVSVESSEIPPTYVPARNTIFLSFAVSYAEAINAEAIFIGATAIDYSGYPDCRPEYFEAFKRLIELGTKKGAEGGSIKIIAPLIDKSKSEIIRLGKSLGVPYELTWSCYQGGEVPCGVCDSCKFRNRGFEDAKENS